MTDRSEEEGTVTRILVLVDDSSRDLARRVRSLLGEGHDYKVLAVAPDFRTPFLGDDTVRSVQEEAVRDHWRIAQEAAEAVGAAPEVREGNPAVEAVDAAHDAQAEIVVMEGRPRGFWRRLAARRALDDVLGHGRCAVLLVPPQATSSLQ